MRHKLATVVFAQGWIGNQIEKAAADAQADGADAKAAEVLAQWRIIDEGMDDLVQAYQALEKKVFAAQNALNS